MNEEEKLRAFIKNVRNVSPLVTSRADIIHTERGFEPEDESYSLWLGAFADATNELMETGNSSEIGSIFKFISNQVDIASHLIYEHIDVSFVENLFYKVSVKGVELGWGLLPWNLKELYIKFHGQKPH